MFINPIFFISKTFLFFKFFKKLWNGKNLHEKLIKEFEFQDFLETISFVNKITQIAEEMQPPLDLLIHSYNKLKIILFTHSENQITKKDYELAKRIDEIKT